MAGKQAKTLTDQQVKVMMAWCDARRRYPHRDKVVILLSVKAGLRAMEIAGLRRWHVMESDGGVSDRIHLENRISKKGSGRIIPMAPLLQEHVCELFRIVPGLPGWPLILSERAMTWTKTRPLPEDNANPYCMRPNSIVALFWLMFTELGYIGCSSHSGRRTFGTRGARLITQAGGSLRDIQQLLGHQNLTTTQKYIDGDEEAKKRLVRLL